MDDRELTAVLAAARTGDDAAVAVLFRQMHPRLVRFLRAHERAAADDLAAEVWLAVAAGLRAFDGDAAGLRAWVVVIARRRVADHRRRGVRRRTQPVEPATLDGLRASDDPAQRAVERVSGQAAADLVVACLPPDQADVILLRVLGDLDVATVARVLGRSPNWVRVTQHRALRRLAQRLGPDPL